MLYAICKFNVLKRIQGSLRHLCFDNDIFEHISAEASRFSHYNFDHHQSYQTAVCFKLPGELSILSVIKRIKDVTEYTNS